MQVLVTGSAGLVGKATAQHLRERGWQVREIDILAPENEANSDYRVCDITDFEAVREAVRGCDAIVHMGAIRAPTMAPGHQVYHVNTVGTFNVYEAAAQEGIKRIVQASSINALGCAWNIGELRLEYLPVDEEHPTFTTDPYSFSKQQVEAIGAYYWRREQISGVALRFPGIYDFEKRDMAQVEERRTTRVQFIDAFRQLDPKEREEQITKVSQQTVEFRAARNLEYPLNNWHNAAIEYEHQQLWFTYAFDRFNFWAAIDLRDVAQSIEDGLSSEYDGSHPLFITHSHNSLDYDSHILAELFFPDVKHWKQEVSGTETLLSINRARELIGFEPKHSLYKG